MTTKIARKRKAFTVEFKQQMVELHKNGKRKSDLVREYELTPSALDRWIKQATETGDFTESGNRSPYDTEMLALKTQNKQLLMENDILKQAALIFGRR
jgi:transposase